MTEAQFFPSVAGSLVDGVEIENQDLALIGQTAGLADDRVFSDVLRLFPTNGTTIARAILPYEDARLDVDVAGLPASTVQSTGSPDHSVNIRPFRAIVGSRVAASDPSPGAGMRNWRDLRSANFAPAGGVLAVQLNAGAGAGQNRWDLVYATLTIDTPPANGVTRRVKSPTSHVVTAQTVSQYLAASVTVQVLQGAPNATPTPPAIPPDGGNAFNIPLALVRVVGTDTTGSTLVAQDIRCATNTTVAQTTTRYMSAKHGFQAEPATGNNDQGGTYDSQVANAWSPTSHARPAAFIPPDMVGGKCVFALIDVSSGTSTNWSHPDGSVVDDSIDWRGRIIKTDFQFAAGVSLATVAGTSAYSVPSASQYTTGGSQMANTISDVNNLLVASTFTVCYFTHNVNAALPAGTICGLYVDQNDGVLRWTGNGIGQTARPGVVFAFMLFASAPMSNH